MPRRVIASVLFLCLAGFVRAHAGQLDPLLFLKEAPRPNVVLAVEATTRMQIDGSGSYRDPRVYTRTGAAWETTLGVTPGRAPTTYRRKYLRLRGGPDGAPVASSIDIVGDAEPGYAGFDTATRLHRARLALAEVVERNREVARFGLVKTRQVDPQYDAAGGQPLWSEAPSQQAPSERPLPGGWSMARPTVAAPNASVDVVLPALVEADGAAATERIEAILNAAPGEPLALLPAGQDPPGLYDAPIASLLADARAEAVRLIAADGSAAACRNTVVVLVVAGSDGDPRRAADLGPAASTFLDVGGRRVPVYVIALAPAAADVPVLREVAAASGGQFAEVTAPMLERADEGIVARLSEAIHCAVQHALASAADVDARPTAAKPFGPPTVHQISSPVVATVDLRGATAATGAALPATVITSPGSSLPIPQRSNVMVGAGFSVPGEVGAPGFPGWLSAFRVYRPDPDVSRPSGYRFVADGTLIWRSATPPPASRNLYTATPEGTLVPFTAENAPLLAPWLRTTDPAALIDEVREWPLGAVISSTPALLDTPSLDPAPDEGYPRFAESLRRRRSLVFAGANDGMLHAFDARLGVEVWAFIPFNLLPRLRLMARGQAAGAFEYGVDASPRIADIRTSRGWRTWLVVGQGLGGTFYQALDVTLAELPAAIAPDDDNLAALLAYFARPDRIPLAWSFPDYRHFDPSAGPRGELSGEAALVERTVGATSSVPAIVELLAAPGRHVVLTGSGFYPPGAERSAGRFPASSQRVGTTLYMLDAETGGVVDARDVGNDGEGEDVERCTASGECGALKNALQADVVTVGQRPGSRRASAAYAADLDGRLWRFTLGAEGGLGRLGPPLLLYDADRPVFSLVAASHVGGQTYVFFGTGSDRLPALGTAASASTVLGWVDGGSAAGGVTFAFTLAGGGGAGPRLTGAPSVAGDVVFFAGTSRDPIAPCAAPVSSLYAVTFAGGAAYDTTGDGVVDERDARAAVAWPKARILGTLAADRHLVVGTSNGIEVFGDQQDYNTALVRQRPRVLSWRLLRSP